jgi:site-specific recombinase XerD
MNNALDYPRSTSDFSLLLALFLSDYLPVQRNVSENTLLSYCDSFRLFLTYCRDECKINIEKVQMKDFSAKLVTEFLDWITSERKCGISTRNQRLAAIHAFFRYAQVESPQSIAICQSILAVPFSKKTKKLVNYLTVEDMTNVLQQPDTTTVQGRRDMCFLCLLYDTGARVSEITGMKVRDIRLEHPAKATLLGKGNKLREVPLLVNTTQHLQVYINEQRLTTPDKLDNPLFFNRQGKALTRTGATYILKKYIKNSSVETHVSPHTLRHSKAMHLLESGINIFYIKGLLGHEDIATTEVYAKANVEMKRTALEKHASILPVATPSWANNSDTIEWLKNFGKKVM